MRVTVGASWPEWRREEGHRADRKVEHGHRIVRESGAWLLRGKSRVCMREPGVGRWDQLS